MEQLKESHQAELEQVGQEKDMRILELLQSLDQLRTELAAAEAMGAAEKEAEQRKMESVATQTEPTSSVDESTSMDEEREGDTPAVLPVEAQTDSVCFTASLSKQLCPFWESYTVGLQLILG